MAERIRGFVPSATTRRFAAERRAGAERILGLPREPDPHKGQAWKDVPRS